MNAHYWLKRAGLAFAAIAVIGLIVLGWYATRPGPLAFAAGKSVALDAFSGHPTGVPADFSEKDNVARGRYLAQAADCESCHTVNESQPFAGGLAFKTPFGTLYSPNITPDKETGIGAWSDADFLKAVHEGVDREGERLYPAFPYAAYTYLADDDVLAIKAYLFSLTPVKNAPPEADLRFPYNQRWLMAFWSGLFNPKQRFQPVVDRSPEWNRGAYLAEALAHCGDCHTPRNLLQALDNKNKFAGAVADGWRAYNITADSATGVGAWSEAELAEYLSTGHANGRGTASGPMAQAVDFSFEKMTPGDIRAIVTYLRSVPAIAASDLPASKDEPAPVDPKQGLASGIDPRGTQVFEGACASCHAWTGVSLLDSRATLTGSRAVNDPTAINVAQIVLSGSKWQPADSTLSMPAFGAAYNDREIAAVANYVTARFGTKPSSITAEDVRKLRAVE
ncbi:MAG TPA: cytochrome c [Rudaea sp.]|jgi:mono/diheme cytochrome c family protein|nr:cytochrome c [Rudaea sp.]